MILVSQSFAVGSPGGIDGWWDHVSRHFLLHVRCADTFSCNRLGIKANIVKNVLFPTM